MQTQGVTQGAVRSILRAEGLVLLICAMLLYGRTEQSWWMFAGLLLLPDVALFGYLAGPRIGAVAYNAVHSLLGPLFLGIASGGDGLAFALALIWLAHCGMDRAVGYGLKYSTAFGHTHLGIIGKQRVE